MNVGIVILIIFSVGVYVGIIISRQYKAKELYYVKEKNKKRTEYYYQLNQWFTQYLAGKRIENYFKEREIKRIAIYGWNELAARLCDELKNSEIEIVAIIDRKAEQLKINIPVYSLNEKMPKMDILVVASSYYFYEIREEMEKKVTCSITALGDILCEL